MGYHQQSAVNFTQNFLHGPILQRKTLHLHLVIKRTLRILHCTQVLNQRGFYGKSSLHQVSENEVGSKSHEKG